MASMCLESFQSALVGCHHKVLFHMNMDHCDEEVGREEQSTPTFDLQ